MTIGILSIYNLHNIIKENFIMLYVYNHQKILFVRSNLLSTGLNFLYSLIFSASGSLGYSEIELLVRILWFFEGDEAYNKIWEFFINLYSCSSSSLDLLAEWKRKMLGSFKLLFSILLYFDGLLFGVPHFSLISILKSGKHNFANFKNALFYEIMILFWNF